MLTIKSNVAQIELIFITIKLILITTELIFSIESVYYNQVDSYHNRVSFFNRIDLLQLSPEHNLVGFFQSSRFIKIESTTMESILSTIESILSIIESILRTYTTHFWIDNFETNGLP